MTGFDIAGRLLAVTLTALVVLLVVTAIVTWRFVLPAAAISALAVGTGLLRTVALAGFLALAVLRLLMNALESAGEAVPAPGLRRTKVVTA